uniref:Protein kinase domain-containing protein n=1 Tax=Quercus lobata TaxID=97700 RepID=A0A7N2LIZ8_QUELO
MLFETTNNFSNDHKIGTGSFFSVYHADDGREVAIKCENGACACEINLKALSRHSHNNLVCLLGFCEDSIKPIWVYEYMKNGSLHDHLHKLQSSPLMSSWATWIKVALDAAKGIAKVSEIGHFVKQLVVDKMEHFFDLVEMGALHYMDPEYRRQLNVQLTTKTDVYCFGVVLLEILSGYKATDINGNEELHSYIAQNKICKMMGKVNREDWQNTLENCSRKTTRMTGMLLL